MRTTVLMSASVAVAGLVLGGCSDAPTAAPANPVTITATGAARHAATTVSHQVLKKMPTIALWEATQQPKGALSDKTVNSPYDLTFLGGPVVQHATEFNVYVNCAAGPASCWGTGNLTPATVLRDLNASNILRVADQYLNEDADGRFKVQELNTAFTFSGAPTATAPGGTASIDDIFTIVASAALNTNANGYANEFHVFLPKGTDMCIAAGDCYSPDIPGSFDFCAFHSSVDVQFSAGSTVHLIFSVEPFQGVGGCSLPTTQTRVIDGTASTLSHEFIESITDPDGDAWFNLLTGNEVSDLCFGFRHNTLVGAHVYAVQEQYSNAIHDCTDGNNGGN